MLNNDDDNDDDDDDDEQEENNVLDVGNVSSFESGSLHVDNGHVLNNDGDYDYYDSEGDGNNDSCVSHTDTDEDEKDVRDIAMSWLIKLRQVHGLSEAALSDVIELSKDVYLHYCKRIERAVLKDCCNVSCMIRLQDHLTNSMAMDDLDGICSSYQQQIFIRDKYSYVVSIIYNLKKL